MATNSVGGSPALSPAQQQARVSNSPATDQASVTRTASLAKEQSIDDTLSKGPGRPPADTGLRPPKPPDIRLSADMVGGASAFSASLEAIDRSIDRRSDEGLLLAFMRLQMLDNSVQQRDGLVSDLLRRDMRSSAHNGATNVMNVFFSVSQRAGTEALLRTAAEESKEKNDLAELLAGNRPDQEGKRTALEEIDQNRLEVAKLVLEVVDRHLATKANTASRFPV